MAETFLRSFGGDKFEVESVGLEPTELNPIVVEAMAELGFDLSRNTTKSVFEFYKQGKLFDYVITVCDEAVEDRCPIFPGLTKRMHWPFKNPAALNGTHQEKLAGTRKIRDEIKATVEKFLNSL